MDAREPLVIRALRRQPVERIPIWLMRQAGRYMAEYRAVREKIDFLGLCHSAELAAKVTLDAVEVLDVDAAIIFSDILVPAEAMGAKVAFSDKGPEILEPIRGPSAIDALRVPDPERDLAFVAESLRRVRAALDPDKALLGFAGAPFTVASYLVEGRSTRDFVHTKRLMFCDPKLFARLLDRIAEATIPCVLAQAEAGAEAIQLFDSWAGALAPQDYVHFALPPTAKILDALRARGIPTILYANGGSTLLEGMAQSGADCISVDWRVEIADAWRRIGFDKAIQGNLDPLVLVGPLEIIERRAREIIDQVEGRPGFVFNLGHGIDRHTPVDAVQHLVRIVRG